MRSWHDRVSETYSNIEIFLSIDMLKQFPNSFKQQQQQPQQQQQQFGSNSKLFVFGIALLLKAKQGFFISEGGRSETEPGKTWPR